MKISILRPSFYEDFHCIASECKNSCCKDWGIIWTKEEFKELKKQIHSPEIKEKFKDAFIANENEQFSASKKLKTKLTKDGTCPFLDEHNLCGIYQECGGQKYMSYTCQHYPRIEHFYLDRQEEYLTPSCEAVVTLLMKERRGIQFAEGEPRVILRSDKSTSAIRYDDLERRPLLRYYYDIKVLMTSVLQCRDYSVAERIVILGIAMQHIDILEKEKREEEIPAYVDSFLANVDKKEIKEMVSQWKGNLDMKTSFLLDIPSTVNVSNLSMIRTFGIMMEKLKVKIEYTAEEKGIKRTYAYSGKAQKEAWNRFLKAFESREYLLENFMLISALVLNLPIVANLGMDIWKNYCFFANVYCIYSFLLGCCLDEEYKEEDFIYYTTEIFRLVLHSPYMHGYIKKRMEETESDTLAHVALLVL